MPWCTPQLSYFSKSFSTLDTPRNSLSPFLLPRRSSVSRLVLNLVKSSVVESLWPTLHIVEAHILLIGSHHIRIVSLLSRSSIDAVSLFSRCNLKRSLLKAMPRCSGITFCAAYMGYTSTCSLQTLTFSTASFT